MAVDDGLKAFSPGPSPGSGNELVDVVVATHDANGLTIRRGLGQHVSAQVVRCTRPVVNDDRLPHGCHQLVANDARNGVNGSTGQRRHDDLDRLAGIGALAQASVGANVALPLHPGQDLTGICVA